jgi:Resolvase, N terminal domain/ParB-like nuclease domain
VQSYQPTLEALNQVDADALTFERPSRSRSCCRRRSARRERPWPADKVERWAIKRLIPYAKNARTHTDAQVAAIAASIKEWGWTTPALVGEDGGLIAGHARILAARQLGIAEIPVMVAAGWSEAQKRAWPGDAELVEMHPEKRLVGYARVSTYGQTLDSQLEQLRAAGCSSRSIYREKATGARPDRRELNRMLGKLAPATS